jgi:transcriptional regulator with XRE-family HTH domain
VAYDPLNTVVGKRLATTRKDLKLSQETVCGMSGMKQTTLSTIESGRGGIRLTNLVLLCGIYGKTVAEVLTGLEIELAEVELTEQIVEEFEAAQPPESQEVEAENTEEPEPQ